MPEELPSIGIHINDRYRGIIEIRHDQFELLTNGPNKLNIVRSVSNFYSSDDGQRLRIDRNDLVILINGNVQQAFPR